METRLYNIDSKDRNKTIHTNSNSFIFTEKSSGDIQPFGINNIINLNIKNIILPNTIYFINSTKGNNVFTVDGTTITISSGSYTVSDLVYELDNNSTLSGKSLAFEYNNYTGKLKISNTSGSPIQFQFPDIDIYNDDSLKNLLGFKDDSFDTNITIAVGDNILDYPMEPAIEKYFFIRINDIGNIYYKNRQYMAKIYNEYKYRYDDINLSNSYSFTSHLYKFNQPVDIKAFNISIVDKYNNNVELNNMDYSLTLEVTTVYNSVLKRYYESITYSDEVMNKLVNKKILEYIEYKLDDNKRNNQQLNEMIQKLKDEDDEIINDINMDDILEDSKRENDIDLTNVIINNDLNEFDYNNNINIINNEIENSHFNDSLRK
jgi:hypothetical protein